MFKAILMEHTYGIAILYIIQCTCVNSIDVDMNESIVGTFGDSDVQLTCYYTLEDEEEIISVEMKAINHSSNTFSTLALFKPDRTSLLTISGNYLAGRIMLSVIDTKLRQATIRFTDLEYGDEGKYQCKVSFFTLKSGLDSKESSATQIVVTERQEDKQDNYNCNTPTVVGITVGSIFLVIVAVVVLIITLLRKRKCTLHKNQKCDENQKDRILQDKKSPGKAVHTNSKVQTQKEHKQSTYSKNKKDVPGSIKTNEDDTQTLITCPNTTDDRKNSNIKKYEEFQNYLDETSAIPWTPTIDSSKQGKTYIDTEYDLLNRKFNERKRTDKEYGARSSELCYTPGYPSTLIGLSSKYRNSADETQIGIGYSTRLGHCSRPHSMQLPRYNSGLRTPSRDK